MCLLLLDIESKDEQEKNNAFKTDNFFIFFIFLRFHFVSQHRSVNFFRIKELNALTQPGQTINNIIFNLITFDDGI